MRKQRRIDGWALERISELRRDHPQWTAADICRELDRDPEKGDRPTPSERTVRDILKEPPVDESAPWLLEPSPHPDAARILELQAEVIRRTNGEIRTITVAEASWYTTLHGVSPGLGALEKFRLARLYISRRALGFDTSDLELFLYVRPWEGEAKTRRYRKAIDSGLFREAPAFLTHRLRSYDPSFPEQTGDWATEPDSWLTDVTS